MFAAFKGDTCGEPGVDCAACRAACIDCKDGNDGEYGCCSECVLGETELGELICSGFAPQFSVCEYDVCGTIVGLTCDKGFVCEDDPRDDCDPKLGGADCAGICVEEIAKPVPACGGIDYCQRYVTYFTYIHLTNYVSHLSRLITHQTLIFVLAIAMVVMSVRVEISQDFLYAH